MANVRNAYTSFGNESAYGTPVAATKGYECVSESVEGDYSNKLVSEANRPGKYLASANRIKANHKGASGDITLEGGNKGLGFWLRHMLGNAVTGVTTAGVTAHTFTVGDTRGKSFTYQKEVVDSEGAENIKTYQGGKISEWEITNTIDDYLKLNLSLDFQKETLGAGSGPLAKQTPTYVEDDADFKPFDLAEAVLTFGGTALSVKDISIKGTMGLALERYFNGSHLKKEPIQGPRREITIELTTELENLAQQIRAASLNEAASQAALVVTWTATNPEAGGGVSSLTVTFPAVSILTASAPLEDMNAVIEQKITAMVAEPTSGQGSEPVTVVYVTPDAVI